MTEREKIVEVMAREAKAVLGEMLNAKILPHPIGKPGDWVASGDGQSIDLVDAASRFLARLEASGMAVVPVKASETMELAGYVCLDRTNPYGLDVVKNIWAAMLSAASPTPSMTENADE